MSESNINDSFFSFLESLNKKNQVEEKKERLNTNIEYSDFKITKEVKTKEIYDDLGFIRPEELSLSNPADNKDIPEPEQLNISPITREDETSNKVDITKDNPNNNPTNIDTCFSPVNTNNNPTDDSEKISFDFSGGLSFDTSISNTNTTQSNHTEQGYNNTSDTPTVNKVDLSKPDEPNELDESGGENDVVYITGEGRNNDRDVVLNTDIYTPIQPFSEEVINNTKFVIDLCDVLNSNYTLKVSEDDNKGIDVNDFTINRYDRNKGIGGLGLVEDKSDIVYNTERNGRTLITRFTKDTNLPKRRDRPTRKVQPVNKSGRPRFGAKQPQTPTVTHNKRPRFALNRSD